MRVIFFGTSAFAVPSLEGLLAQGHAVVSCITQPDRRSGRGLVPEPSPVKQAAVRLRLPLLQPQRPQRDLVVGAGAEIGVVAAYGELLSADLLALPTHGMVGVHPSLLPAYRGAAPVAWAILNGERQTGVTIFRLNERLDAGEILTQRRTPIELVEDAQRLTDRLARLGAEALIEGLKAIAVGTARWTPQEEARASAAPKLTKADGVIRWDEPAEAIVRRIRAMVPWPGAVTTQQGTSLKLWRASVTADTPGSAPGTVQPRGPVAGRVVLLAKEEQA